MKPKIIWSLALAVIVIVNLTQSLQDIIQEKAKRQKVPFFFAGYKFYCLEKVFKDIKYAGYYTDKNLDEPVDAAQFAQAQYILAPTILDLNNTSHTFIIFDCTNEELALTRIKEIGAVPIKRSPFGLILARKKQIAHPAPSTHSSSYLKTPEPMNKNKKTVWF